MFKEIYKQRIPFSHDGKDYFLRYDNNALRQLEEMGINFGEIGQALEKGETARAILAIGLETCIPNANARKKAAVKLIDNVDFGKLYMLVISAVMLALPISKGGNFTGGNKNENADCRKTMTLYCDIMGRSDDEFWSSTLREVFDRWEAYAEIKGYKKPAIHIKQYDDD